MVRISIASFAQAITAAIAPIQVAILMRVVFFLVGLAFSLSTVTFICVVWVGRMLMLMVNIERLLGGLLYFLCSGSSISTSGVVVKPSC